MPIHYAQDINIQKGTLNFVNEKEIEKIFDKPFVKPPKVNLSFYDSNVPATNPCIIKKSKIKFSAKFTNPVTTSIEWTAVE